MTQMGRCAYVPVTFSAFRRHMGQKSVSGAAAYRDEREAARRRAQARSVPWTWRSLLRLAWRVRMSCESEAWPALVAASRSCRCWRGHAALCGLLAGTRRGQKQHMIKFLQRWAALIIEPRRLLSLRYLPRYAADWVRFRRAAGAGTARVGDSFPMLSDRLETTPFDPHYLHQGAWLARRLADAKPEQHVDIGSSVLAMSVLVGPRADRLRRLSAAQTHHDGPVLRCGRYRPAAIRRYIDCQFILPSCD